MAHIYQFKYKTMKLEEIKITNADRAAELLMNIEFKDHKDIAQAVIVVEDLLDEIDRLRSLHEIPQVDELIKYAQHLDTCDFEFYESGIHPCTCGLDKLLPSPPTKTE